MEVANALLCHATRYVFDHESASAVTRQVAFFSSRVVAQGSANSRFAGCQVEALAGRAPGRCSIPSTNGSDMAFGGP